MKGEFKPQVACNSAFCMRDRCPPLDSRHHQEDSESRAILISCSADMLVSVTTAPTCGLSFLPMRRCGLRGLRSRHLPSPSSLGTIRTDLDLRQSSGVSVTEEKRRVLGTPQCQGVAGPN